MRKMTAAMAALGVVAGLGAAALPLSSYAASTAAQKTVPVTAIIDKSLSIEVRNGDDTQLDATGVKLEGVVAGGNVVSKSVNVVVTNNGENAVTGTALTIQAANNTTALEKKEGGIVTATINTGGANVKNNTTTSAWGYALGGDTTYKAVKTTADPITLTPSTGSLATGASASAKVTFGVAAASTQASGTYTGGVIFTASATTAD